MALHKTEEINAQQFQEEIIEGKKTALICFYADWSAPCREMRQVVEQITDVYYGTVRVAFMDPEESPLVAAEYMVTSIPTLLVFTGAEAVDRMVGVRTYEDVEKMLIRYL